MDHNLDWKSFLSTPAGKTTLTWEADAYARFTSTQSGDRALQIGLWSLDTLAASPIGLGFALNPEIDMLSDEWYCPIVAQPWAIPLDNDTCNLLTLPHTLDQWPTKADGILQESYRVLDDNGLLLLTAFNPTGGWHLFDHFRKHKRLPAGAAKFSVNQLKNLLASHNFTLEGGNFGVYCINQHPNDFQSKRLPTLLDQAGDRWWPTWVNVVLLSARKRTQRPSFVGKVKFKNQHIKSTAPAVSHKHF